MPSRILEHYVSTLSHSNDYLLLLSVHGPRSTLVSLPSVFSKRSHNLPKLILRAGFFEHWVLFRDQMPLSRGTAVPTVAPKDKEAMNESVIKMYDLMGSMSYCKYDRPNRDERTDWDMKEWLEYLVYPSARNLARNGHTFAVTLQRANLKNEAGRREAFHRLRGLIMLVSDLCINYTLMAPSNVIKRIEAARPAKHPNLSMIPRVRVKWQLSNMGVDTLRKEVLDCQRKGKGEKEWLIGILIGKEIAPRVTDVGTGTGVLAEILVKKEDSAELIEVKRRVDIAVDHEFLKAKKDNRVGVVGIKRASIE